MAANDKENKSPYTPKDRTKINSFNNNRATMTSAPHSKPKTPMLQKSIKSFFSSPSPSIQTKLVQPSLPVQPLSFTSSASNDDQTLQNHPTHNDDSHHSVTLMELSDVPSEEPSTTITTKEFPSAFTVIHCYFDVNFIIICFSFRIWHHFLGFQSLL